MAINKNLRRADIDLLRAFAVLSVILFHFDVPGLQGGFLGVDVFFVISGYLITTHLSDQMKGDKFTFLSFYGRRVKRLMPALLCTLVLTAIASLWILPSALLNDFSESLVATSLYASNIFFYWQAGYFDTESHLKPLLHTWSLSVEEQFYLVWPLLILGAIKLKKLRLSIVVLAIGSLLAAEWFYKPGDSFTFFMFPFRIFEFAVGAILYGVSLKHFSQFKRTLISALGWGLVIASILLLDEQSRMPGLLSLPVCIGTALIIMSGQRYTYLPAKALWLRIGLTSYSSYLLHWPLVVFYKILIANDLTWLDVVALLVLTLLGAEFMYRFVEQRKWLYRLGIKLKSPFYWVFFINLFAAMFFLLSPIFYKYNNTSTVTEVWLNTAPYKQVVTEFKGSLNKQNDDKKLKSKIVVIGDSHSLNFAWSFAPLVKEQVKIMHSVCDPLSGNALKGVDLIEYYKNHGNPSVKAANCDEYHREFVETVTTLAPDFIIFSERWRKDATPYLKKTIEDLKSNLDAEILITGRNVEFLSDPELLLSDIKDINMLNKVAQGRLHDLNFINQELLTVAKNTGAYYLLKSDIVCPNGQCQFIHNNGFTYSDSNHWSNEGIKKYGELIVNHKSFNQFLQKKPPEYINTTELTSDKRKVDVSSFPSITHYYNYVLRSYRGAAKDAVLVAFGDISMVEVVSAYYSQGYSESIFANFNQCPPIVATSLSDIDASFFAKRKLSKADCIAHSKYIFSEIERLNIDKIIIAYNWTPELLEPLEKTLNKLSNSNRSNTFLFGLKPRLFKDPKVSLKTFEIFNTKLSNLAARVDVNYVDIYDKLCDKGSINHCSNELNEMYRSPNALSKQGVIMLSKSRLQ